MVAATDRHSTSPLPGFGGTSGSACSRLTTRAPAATALMAVSSVEPESSTISSSTRPPSSGLMVSITAATVSCSLSAGNTTETVRPFFAAISCSTVHSGRFQLWVSSQPGGCGADDIQLESIPTVEVMPTPSLFAPVGGSRRWSPPFPACGVWAQPHEPGTCEHPQQPPVRSRRECPRVVPSVPHQESPR
ncbi:Uncharacterised protein [Mycobacteroides abscessus]|nr:Uncharacterised protein [Mycobacteroides abscessus]